MSRAGGAAVRRIFPEHLARAEAVDVELPDERAQVVVLEVERQHVLGELRPVNDLERVTMLTPADQVVDISGEAISSLIGKGATLSSSSVTDEREVTSDPSVMANVARPRCNEATSRRAEARARFDARGGEGRRQLRSNASMSCGNFPSASYWRKIEGERGGVADAPCEGPAKGEGGERGGGWLGEKTGNAAKGWADGGGRGAEVAKTRNHTTRSTRCGNAERGHVTEHTQRSDSTTPHTHTSTCRHA